MRLLRGATTAFILASIPTLLLASETVREKFDRVYDFQPGTRLTLRNENGSITVRTWDKNAVHVEAEKRARSGNADRSREALRDVKIDVHAEGKTLVVETDTPDMNDGFFEWLEGKHVQVDVAYVITVPKSLHLEAETVNGAIDVTAVSGDLKLSTTNGRISLAEGSGSLQAETTNGAIHAELQSVTPGARMSLSTTNGGIELAIPSDTKAELHASTTNGSVQSDIPVLTEGADKNSLDGTINGGGPKIELETTNGGIRIRKSN